MLVPWTKTGSMTLGERRWTGGKPKSRELHDDRGSPGKESVPDLSLAKGQFIHISDDRLYCTFGHNRYIIPARYSAMVSFRDPTPPTHFHSSRLLMNIIMGGHLLICLFPTPSPVKMVMAVSYLVVLGVNTAVVKGYPAS